MKKFLALLLSCMLLLSLVPAASADTTALSFEARDANLNRMSNTISVQQDDGFWMLANADGEILVPASEEYTEMYPYSGYPFFRVEKNVPDGIHREGLIDGFGKVLVPPQYADVEIISERWQAGVKLTPSDADNKDYTYTNYSTDEKSFYRIDTVDLYFDGAFVGTVTRAEYAGNSSSAYGAYLCLKNVSGDRTFYDRNLQPSPYTVSYSGEYDSQYSGGKTTYIHQGSGQIAFQPDCTLDPADLENPYLYDHGVVYDIRGTALFETKAYDSIRQFNDGFAVTRMSSKEGLLSLDGREIIPAEYDDLGNYEEHPLRYGYISAVKDGKFGFLDAEGKISAPFTYSSDVVRNYGTFGTVKDLDGSIIVISAAMGQLPEHYVDVTFPSSDGCMAFVAENAQDQSAVIDLYGTQLLPFSSEYRYIYLTEDGTVALVYLGNHQYTVFQFEIVEPEHSEEDGWTCENGHRGNTGNFCTVCGAARPAEGPKTCSSCGYELPDPAPNFCPNCGSPVN